MADEITISGSLQFSKGSSSDFFGKTGALADMAGSKYIHTRITVATSATAIDLGNIGTPGWFYAFNHDATNFVKIRAGAGGADLVKLLAGEAAGPFRLATATPYAIADTATCELEYLIVEA